MTRSSLDPDGVYEFVGLMGANVPEVLWRDRVGIRGRSEQIDGLDARHQWVRLERVGNDVWVSISEDGSEWTPVDSRSVEFGDEAYFGLAVCSTVEGQLAEARFESVRVERLEP